MGIRSVQNIIDAAKDVEMLLKFYRFMLYFYLAHAEHVESEATDCKEIKKMIQNLDKLINSYGEIKKTAIEKIDSDDRDGFFNSIMAHKKMFNDLLSPLMTYCNFPEISQDIENICNNTSIQEMGIDEFPKWVTESSEVLVDMLYPVIEYCKNLDFPKMSREIEGYLGRTFP